MFTVIPKEWIQEPDEKGDGLLLAETDSFPLPIETHRVALEDVTLGVPQEFEFVFEGAHDIRIYTNEAVYFKRKGSSFAPESFVPAGLYSPTNDPDFEPTARAYINGKVTITYKDPTEFGFSEDDTLYTMTCMGYEIDAYVPREVAEMLNLEVGNIVTGGYWVQGWPKGT